MVGKKDPQTVRGKTFTAHRHARLIPVGVPRPGDLRSIGVFGPGCETSKRVGGKKGLPHKTPTLPSSAVIPSR